MEPTLPYWQAAPVTPGEPLRADIDADVVVVGGGLAGLGAARSLLDAKPGLDLVLIETQHLGFGASGRNGGIIEAPLLIPMWLIDGALPEAEARWALEHLYMRAEAEIARLRKLGAGEHLVSSRVLFSARSRVAREALRYAHQRLARTPVPCGWLQAHQVETLCGSRGHGALDLGGYAANPMGLVHTLTRAVRVRGARVYEGTRLTDIQSRGHRSLELSVEGGHRVWARSVVMCTGAWTRRLPLAKRPLLHPAATYVVATEPLDDAQLERLGGKKCSVSEIFSMSFRRIHDCRLIFGGTAKLLDSAETTPGLDRKRLGKLVNVLNQSLPWLEDVRLELGWGGTTSATRAGVPAVVADPSLPGLVYNVGHPAFLLALLGGDMVRGMVLGDSYADNEAERLRAALGSTRARLGKLTRTAVGWLMGAMKPARALSLV